MQENLMHVFFLKKNIAFLKNQNDFLVQVIIYKTITKNKKNTYGNNPQCYNLILHCRLLSLHKGSLCQTVGDRCMFETSFDSWYPLHNFHYSYSILRTNQMNSKTHELLLYSNYMRIGKVYYAVLFWRAFQRNSTNIKLITYQYNYQPWPNTVWIKEKNKF